LFGERLKGLSHRAGRPWASEGGLPDVPASIAFSTRVAPVGGRSGVRRRCRIVWRGWEPSHSGVHGALAPPMQGPKGRQRPLRGPQLPGRGDHRELPSPYRAAHGPLKEVQIAPMLTSSPEVRHEVGYLSAHDKCRRIAVRSPSWTTEQTHSDDGCSWLKRGHEPRVSRRSLILDELRMN